MSEILLDPKQFELTTALDDAIGVTTDKEWAARIVVVNTTGSAKTFRLAVAPGGAADDLSQYIAYDETINANSHVVFEGLTMRSGTIIRTKASANTALVLSLFGVERDV